MRRTVPILALLAVLAAPAAAETSERAELDRVSSPHAGRVAYDLVVQRPLGLVQLAVGAVVFVPAWPVSLLFGGGDDVYRACIEDPAKQVFATPLGRL